MTTTVQTVDGTEGDGLGVAFSQRHESVVVEPGHAVVVEQPEDAGVGQLFGGECHGDGIAVAHAYGHHLAAQVHLAAIEQCLGLEVEELATRCEHCAQGYNR